MTDAKKGNIERETAPRECALETRHAEKAFYFETNRADGGWVHRSVLAK